MARGRPQHRGLHLQTEPFVISKEPTPGQFADGPRLIEIGCPNGANAGFFFEHLGSNSIPVLGLTQDQNFSNSVDNSNSKYQGQKEVKNCIASTKSGKFWPFFDLNVSNSGLESI